MKRGDAIKQILNDVEDEVIISSVGMTSRELYRIKDRPRNFYMMSAMGSELAVGLGLAYTRPDLRVIVISGDGSFLMGMNTIATWNWLQQKKGLYNLKHYILNNNCHATTGGQETSFNSIIRICNPFTLIKISKEKGDAPRIPLKPKEITRRFKHAISLNST